MAKAKNIATGTISTSRSKTLTISGIGFKADHIAVLIQSNGEWYAVQTAFDGNGAYYDGGPTFKTANIPITFSEDGVTMSISDVVVPGFVGTYQWVAWQE